MVKHDIDLGSFLSKDHTIREFKDQLLHITTMSRFAARFDKENMPVKSYVYLPETYKLPLRIDLTVKIDAPGLYLFLGNGHVNFGTDWSDNRRIGDIIEPDCKTRFFDNHISMNEFTDISVIYDYKEMQILVNGEEKYFSKKEKYMKSELLKELNETGFTLKIACEKRTNLVLKSLSITEYDDSKSDIKHTNTELPRPVLSNEAAGTDQKPVFENCIAMLPEEIHAEILKTDEFLRSLKPMKFKRQIEKHGNKITYLASDYGFSYALHPSNDVMTHSMSWYILTGSKPELWHRKADRMEETLKRLAENSPELAERMFLNLAECIGCNSQCAVRTLYQFKEKKKAVCHGIMKLKMCVSDFEDVRAFISAVNELPDE